MKIRIDDGEEIEVSDGVKITVGDETYKIVLKGGVLVLRSQIDRLSIEPYASNEVVVRTVKP